MTSTTNGEVVEEDVAAARGAKKLAALFNAQVNIMKCQRCKKVVYHTEKVTSSKDGIFHKSCFTCSVCGTPLTTATHKTSVDRTDPEIYCTTHAPKLETIGVGPDSQSISAIVETNKMAQQWKRKVAPKGGGNYGSDALGVSHAVFAQKLNKYDKQIEDKHMFPALLVSLITIDIYVLSACVPLLGLNASVYFYPLLLLSVRVKFIGLPIYIEHQ